MKNQTLVITYKSNDFTNKLIPESMRCASLAGAQAIISKRILSNIKQAVYTDENGGVTEFDMKKRRKFFK